VSDLGQTQAPTRGRPRQASAGKAIVDATLEAIAERAGVGRNTIYRRWTSKEELIVDALQELVVELDFQEDGDVYSLLLEWIRDFVRVFGDPLYGRILPVVLGELQRNPDFARVYSEQIVQPRYNALLEFLEAAVERGELHPEANPEQIVDLLAAPPFVRALPVGLPPFSESYAEDLLEAIWRGIAPPPLRA
jgi:AcrR family transcriptional regulator